MISLKHEYFADCGAYNGDTVRNFLVCSHDGVGAITEEGNVEIEVDSLDHVLADEKVPFIKMDVEGSETQSLIGAKKTILEQRPILSICIYHSMEDMACIPIMLSEWLHEYRFYVRHYMLTSAETVFYAIPKEREER